MPRTAQEHLGKLLSEVGSESSFYGETHFLPFQIESLKLTKVGLFGDFEAHFSRNSINLIYGPCGSGKSTIVRSILLAFGFKHRYFTEEAFRDGPITLRLFPKQYSKNITGVDNSRNATRDYQCLIADAPLNRLPKNTIDPLFMELDRLKIQIIMTASLLIDTFTLSRDIHAIAL
jgi:hypothetical protein